MKKITNLTNSPYDLQGVDGPVRLPAFDSVEGEFSGEYLDLLAASMAVRVEDAEAPAPAPEPEPEPGPAEDLQGVDAAAEPADARAEYEALAGKPADKRWSDKRVAEEIAKLKA
ncbi:hypothetical protein [Delftia tsuruhatensis]|uniref:hypothetical protein n=1 Tax=Delftia tsuruhatensis TaxID=180282 RepID=UPI0020280F12|nr:hypothetical protein [Delftia tsuruhatensis]